MYTCECAHIGATRYSAWEGSLTCLKKFPMVLKFPGMTWTKATAMVNIRAGAGMRRCMCTMDRSWGWGTKSNVRQPLGSRSVCLPWEAASPLPCQTHSGH